MTQTLRVGERDAAAAQGEAQSKGALMMGGQRNALKSLDTWLQGCYKCPR